MDDVHLDEHGRDADGDRVLWKVVKYSNTKLVEEGKKAIAYYFEERVIHRRISFRNRSYTNLLS